MAEVPVGQWAFNDQYITWPSSWSKEVDLRKGLQEMQGLDDINRKRPVKMRGHRLFADLEEANASKERTSHFAEAEVVKGPDPTLPFQVQFTSKFESADQAVLVLSRIGWERRTDVSFPGKSSRVCIVGTGPAALHMYHLLIQKGYNSGNFVFLERGGSYGGSSNLIDLSKMSEGDKAMFSDLAPSYMQPLFGCVRALATELGVKDQMATTEADAGTQPRVFTSVRDYPGDDHVPFMSFLAGCANHVADMGGLARVLKDLAKFKTLHDDLFGAHVAALPVKPTGDAWSGTAKPFAEFVESHDIVSIAPLVSGFLTLNGYLGVDTWPTFNVLMLMHEEYIAKIAELLLRFAKLYQLDVEVPDNLADVERTVAEAPMTLVTRYHKFWQAIAEKHAPNFKFSASVRRVRRGVGRGAAQVRVEWATAAGQEESDVFDYLVWADPLTECLGVDMDLNEGERDIFTQLKHFQLRATTLTQASAPEEEPQFDLFAEHMTGPSVGDGQVLGLRHGARTAEGCRGLLCYQFINPSISNISESELEKVTDVFLAKLPGAGRTTGSPPFVSPIMQHFDQQGLDKGAMWGLKELQGKQQTLWVHPAASFESLFHIINYNEMLFRELGPLAVD